MEVAGYGVDKFLIMFGGLHVDLAALRSIGTLLPYHSWTSAIVEAEVASSGTTESYLPASSVTRTDKHTISLHAVCTN